MGITLSGEAPKGLIPYIIEDSYNNVRALGVEESYIYNGIEMSYMDIKVLMDREVLLNLLVETDYA